ncbi:unnamed protein product [Prunus armeniaca]
MISCYCGVCWICSNFPLFCAVAGGRAMTEATRRRLESQVIKLRQQEITFDAIHA